MDKYAIFDIIFMSITPPREHIKGFSTLLAATLTGGEPHLFAATLAPAVNVPPPEPPDGLNQKHRQKVPGCEKT
jgi:hypothetical protein